MAHLVSGKIRSQGASYRAIRQGIHIIVYAAHRGSLVDRKEPVQVAYNAPSQETVLVVDDDQEILDLLNDVLSYGGYKVLLAGGGHEALELIKQNEIHVAIVDIKMPTMDGIECLRRVKETDKALEVVMITGYADLESLNQTLRSYGALDYVLKPCNPEDILRVVGNAFKKRTSMIDKAQQKNDFEEMVHQLRESQIKYRQVIDESSDMIVVVQDGRVVFANPRALHLTGYDQGELMNVVFLDIVHPDDRAAVEEHCERKVQNEAASETCISRIVGGGGDFFWSEISSIRTIWESKPAILSFIRDITERKLAEEELKDTQERLIQSEKLAALGRFSSGLAHEVKNPLGVILGGIGYLERKPHLTNEELKMALSKIKEATLRADGIIHGLLEFSRPSQLETERVNPQDIIEDTLNLLEYRIPLRNIVIKSESTEEELYIQVNRNQIQQVLFNILLNAVEAMPKGGGNIRVRVYKGSAPEHSLFQSSCVIQITDSGEGISREGLSRLYEPFFTTKRDKKGTGLGLSISKMIVDNHKGHLIIESEPGRGTDVKVVFDLDKGGAP